MNCVYRNEMIHGLYRSFNHQVQEVGKWATHHIRLMANVSHFLQQHANRIMFISTNVLFFVSIHSFVNRLDEKLTKRTSHFNAEQKLIKLLILDGMMLGGSIAVVNFLFSKIMSYPLNEAYLKTIAFIAIAGHTLLNAFGKFLQKNKQPTLEIVKNVKKTVVKPDVFKKGPQIEKPFQLISKLKKELPVIMEGEWEGESLYDIENVIENLDTSIEGEDFDDDEIYPFQDSAGRGICDLDASRKSISFHLAEEAQEFLTDQHKLNKFFYSRS